MQYEKFKWDDVKVLLALARTRTLRGAATRLGINASTVGRRLDALEEAFGMQLFERTPEGILAMEPVDVLLAHAEELELAASQLAHALDDHESSAEGLVRISAPPGIVEDFIAPRLIALHRQYPDITIELDASVGYADLTRHEADLAIRMRNCGSGDLVSRRLGGVDDVLLASARYVAELGVVDDLADARWITWTEDSGHVPTYEWVRKHVGTGAIALRTKSINAQLQAAITGLGVVLFAEVYDGVGGLARVQLAPHLKAELAPFPQENLWLVGHRALRKVPRVAVVWDFLADAMHHPPRPNPC